MKTVTEKWLCLFIAILLTLSLAACAKSSESAATTLKDGLRQPGVFPYAFSAKDLYENDVTEESLGEKEIFFVHFWATWCAPCLVEMPEIAAIAKKYDNRVGFIALLYDYKDNRQGAVNIIESAGAAFTMIDADTEGLEDVLAMLKTGYVPTTIILDRNGEVIGEAIIGAYGSQYSQFLDSALE